MQVIVDTSRELACNNSRLVFSSLLTLYITISTCSNDEDTTIFFIIETQKPDPTKLSTSKSWGALPAIIR